jgi:catechol 2,3-dioxygenase-like lactoylglutathione lyase family enzyme
MKPILDHIAFTVPDLDALIERLARDFGMRVESRSEQFAILADPVSRLKIELGRSRDAEVHFRHFGFRTDDVDAVHDALAEGGMQSSTAPHRRDFAHMYTSFLKQPDGFEIQLVKYD